MQFYVIAAGKTSQILEQDRRSWSLVLSNVHSTYLWDLAMQLKIILVVAYLLTATFKQDFWCPNITLQLKKMTIEMPTPIVDEKWKMKFSFQMNKNNVSLTEKKNLLRMFLVEYKVFKMVDRYLLISFHLVRTGLGQW